MSRIKHVFIVCFRRPVSRGQYFTVCIDRMFQTTSIQRAVFYCLYRSYVSDDQYPEGSILVFVLIVCFRRPVSRGQYFSVCIDCMFQTTSIQKAVFYCLYRSYVSDDQYPEGRILLFVSIVCFRRPVSRGQYFTVCIDRMFQTTTTSIQKAVF